MLQETIQVDGRDITFRASAAIPRMYRIRFRRDILADMRKLAAAMEKKEEDGTEFDTTALQLFEDIAYVMAKHADPSIPNTPEEWLDQFNVFSIYIILPTVLELWGLNVETQVEAKKNMAKVTER